MRSKIHVCVGDARVLGVEEWLVDGKERFSGGLVSH